MRWREPSIASRAFFFSGVMRCSRAFPDKQPAALVLVKGESVVWRELNRA
jgi:hypothetical protein